MSSVLCVLQIVGFIWGFAAQRFLVTFYCIAVGAVIAGIVVIPDWPFYNKHPLSWKEPAPAPVPLTSDGKAATSSA